MSSLTFEDIQRLDRKRYEIQEVETRLLRSMKVVSFRVCYDGHSADDVQHEAVGVLRAALIEYYQEALNNLFAECESFGIDVSRRRREIKNRLEKETS